ncbi:MAG TPA: hypothetical protein VH988_26965 [Thermoanaerobaculia bacterium]|jgi:tetratricopeptide (TPR) repeat protein|nr:hypothetical protein [Thermoanaerobaculia bacterium]
MPYHLDSAQAAALFGLLAEITSELDLVIGEMLWSEIERLPQERRLERIKTDRKYHTHAMFRAVLAAERRAAVRRPQEAVAVAELLVALADRIEPQVAAKPLRFDWRAEAFMTLAHARRAAADFVGSQAALDQAQAFLTYGTGAAATEAGFIVQQASLLGELGQFEEAVRRLNRAEALFTRVGDDHSAGKVLLHQALILRHLEPKRAFDIAEEGLTRLKMGEDERAELSAHYSMAYCQNELGDTDEAEGIVSTYQYLIAQSDENTQLSFEWLLARIRASQGREAEAEQRLRAVHEQYLDRGFRFEAVLTTIDLIELLVRQDRVGEGLYLVQEITPVLNAWGLHKDSLAVMLMLEKHLRQKTAAAAVFREVQDRLRRSWHLNGEVGVQL